MFCYLLIRKNGCCMFAVYALTRCAGCVCSKLPGKDYTCVICRVQADSGKVMLPIAVGFCAHSACADELNLTLHSS